MNKVHIIDKGGGHIVIDGDLTFATIDKQTLKSCSFLTAGKDLRIDLGQVASTDSAGLALMIEWLKHARTRRTQLRFLNIPPQLLTLAKLSGFDKTSHFNLQPD
ncbi:MAG: STAS domain-containing protein [Gammaproteobacteria bacterium]